MSRIVIFTKDNNTKVIFENGCSDVLLVNSDDPSMKQEAEVESDPDIVNRMYDDEYEDDFDDNM